MDPKTLVETQIQGAAELIDRLRMLGHEVTAAFWVRLDDDDRWFLYLAMPLVDQNGPLAAYEVVIDETRKRHDESWLDTMHLRIIGHSDPMAAHVCELQTKYPAPLTTWYQGARLGDIFIDSAYIYPPPATNRRKRASGKVKKP